MIHLLGAVFVAVGTAGLGFGAVAEIRERGRALADMAAGLAVLEQELALSAAPLPVLLSRAASRSTGCARVFYSACGAELEKQDREVFPVLWQRLLGEQKALGEEGRQRMLPLGDVLGRCEWQEQRERIACVRRGLEELSAQESERRKREGRVYQALGLAGGAFLVILLL